mmetsp:Transcript_25836/g.103217  ORF Transcript_25836/g.103217 Transcript_25836/m.103217 type:complete len:256 (+) Transcript_25836:398-1165(+)
MSDAVPGSKLLIGLLLNTRSVAGGVVVVVVVAADVGRRSHLGEFLEFLEIGVGELALDVIDEVVRGFVALVAELRVEHVGGFDPRLHEGLDRVLKGDEVRVQPHVDVVVVVVHGGRRGGGDAPPGREVRDRDVEVRLDVVEEVDRRGPSGARDEDFQRRRFALGRRPRRHVALEGARVDALDEVGPDGRRERELAEELVRQPGGIVRARRKDGHFGRRVVGRVPQHLRDALDRRGRLDQLVRVAVRVLLAAVPVI